MLQKNLFNIILHLAKDLGYITMVTDHYKKGKPGYADQNQFKAPYLIRFDDDTEWIIFTTTSIRDRVKEQYWDSLNLKEINTKIARAYLVYPF